MTKQHKATPEQWALTEETSGACLSACILELRARVEALEATHHAAEVAPIVVPSLADSLVERVGTRIKWGIDAELDEGGIAHAAILEVAAWFRTERDSPETAAVLEQEANP